MQYLAQCEPRQFYMAWSPTSLSLLCPEHLDLLLPRMSWLEVLQPSPSSLNSHRCYSSDFHITETWQDCRSAVLKYG